MRSFTLSILTAGLILLSASSSTAQMCGDANGDDKVNIADLVALWEHVARNGFPGLDSANSELDNRIGITIGDIDAMVDYIFRGFAPLSCGASLNYSYPQSMSDTIFIPAMVLIPDGITSVSLPLLFSFDPATRAVFLPLLPDPLSGLGHFSYSGATTSSSFISVAITNSDTVVVMAFDLNGSGLTLDDTIITLNYNRIDAGIGVAGPNWTHRTDLLQIAVSRDGELYRPVIVGNIIELPPDSLFISLDQMDFTLTAGKQAKDTFTVDFTANSLPLQFSVSTSQPWIDIIDLPLIELTTPLTLTVTVDGFQVPVGFHSEFISITAFDDSVVVPQNRINLSVTANAPALFQTGDVNCDGIVDIGDLTELISHLFIFFEPLPVCQD